VSNKILFILLALFFVPLFSEEMIIGKKTLSELMFEKTTDTKYEKEIKKFFACFDLESLMS